tara:strand:+ start:442 stop:711 length:270 start_codon:yes stop_codon:yes gene_type:complete
MKSSYSQEYYKKNRERILANNKKWKDANPEKVKQCMGIYRKRYLHKLREKFTCECGGTFTYNNRSKHWNTTKHKDFVAQQIDIIEEHFA